MYVYNKYKTVHEREKTGVLSGSLTPSHYLYSEIKNTRELC